MRDWKLERQGLDSYVVRHRNDSLLLTKARTTSIICEWNQWEKYYLPDFSLDGKTVLDVGAGCGETAYFYFQHGVKRVIAVEIDPVQVGLLKRNSNLNSWNSETHELKIIHRAFELEDLRREKFDFAKIDIEGGEANLLKLDTIDFPLVMEVHGIDLRERLVQKFGFSILVKALPLEEVWLLGNQAHRHFSVK
ncbi:MAG TPA: class I SAM-dependent methyltransferase [Candidatus Angelobacter sp.]|nr:class I SAM-dependent methyltransferase [Candidatus Angelobacter sp.]